MTNAQKWIAIFLGLFLILLVVGRLTKKDESVESLEQYMSQATDTKETDGLKLIKGSGCITCHGSDLHGTRMAPALAGLKEFWSRDKLINYLRNPASFGTDERFVSYKEKFRNIMMPSYSNIDVKDLGKIADYLLSK